MNQLVLSRLMQSFANASLADKVIIAGALHYAKHGDETIIQDAAKAWAEAVKLEIELQHIVDLYMRGLADYTSILEKRTSIAKFVMKVLGEALA